MTLRVPSGVWTSLAFRLEADKAISWLECAYAQRDADMYAIQGDPLFRSVENDSRFKELLRELNLPE